MDERINAVTITNAGPLCATPEVNSLKMKQEIRNHFQSVFNLLLENGKLIIPKPESVATWQSVIHEWIIDDAMPLFVRKGGETRGSLIPNLLERKILTTDNTPAHWVFKNIVIDRNDYTKIQIADLIEAKNFPISFIRKKTEHHTLVGGMVADKNTRLNELGWKLAHIDRIAMKRGNKITIEDYKDHHLSFLALSNMYLIDKDFSGLAEVSLFNELVREYKNRNLY
ncbi:MAG TPA: hypothetical protein VFE53_08860 [Mucilaginibacter sp.]|jgi:hypothetical protein|nr:hypothetical protein [Mucilaginibacter sp.]